MVTLTTPDGATISSVEGWTRPKQATHWQDGRSAKELAKAWFRAENPPANLTNLFLTHFSKIEFWEGRPERETRLPEFGEGRNHDLWLQGSADAKLFTVCIEAKVDEPFGNQSVGAYRASGIARREDGESTRVPERIDSLLRIVGVRDAAWDELRYQLLTGVAGTVLQARLDNASHAAFVVWEFRPPPADKKAEKIEAKKRAANARELDLLLTLLRGETTRFESGMLYGPFPFGDVEIYVGKIVETVT